VELPDHASPQNNLWADTLEEARKLAQTLKAARPGACVLIKHCYDRTARRLRFCIIAKFPLQPAATR